MATAGVPVAHRAVDGTRFLLDGSLDLSAPFTSVADVTIGGRLHEFTTGPIGLADDVVRALGTDRFDEELSYQGGTLLTARTRPHDPQIRLTEDRLVAVWRGRRHSFFTEMYGVATTHLLGVLRTLRIEEHDDGLTLRPVPKGGAVFAAPATVLKQVPGLGLVEMTPLTRERADRLPSWRGLRTQAGELYRDALSDGRPYFVLATTDTWLSLVPLVDTDVEQVPTLVDRFRVQRAR
ncbi:hypothetical protein [Micromonospora sagamiensis]|uniref:Uncharacterized protein n=1 Tax=Micromonospora sagamiensis TaxID=47875 RepID=A0A562WET9_9ACTN|nr:hypothetical protein [Micromonospora sagamiensis]TWJ28793.1 hypothetical protein JD81_02299 [Micromonospora sagamiensis]BCL12301.1 hypothetical protein GCM10017556_00400 [Micromonospora sagamiensis]